MPSIENRLTGEAVQTEVTLASSADLRMVTKSRGWKFNWKEEAKLPGHVIYKITTLDNAKIIHGLLSIEIVEDHVYIHLLENAPFNQQPRKEYRWVMENLVTHACIVSVEAGHEGNVVLTAKTNLVAHYKKQLGAVEVRPRRMIINDEEALKLIHKYGN